MAGEYLVAGELNRRCILTSITFGSSKSADIYAFTPSGGSIARVEVKCTDKTEWALGKKIPNPDKRIDNWFWVFVHLPPDSFNYEEENLTDARRGALSPRYYITVSEEVHLRANEYFNQYKARYLKNHGKKFTGATFHKLKLKDVSQYESQWERITHFVTHRMILDHLNKDK
jgi:hypothetical protein